LGKNSLGEEIKRMIRDGFWESGRRPIMPKPKVVDAPGLRKTFRYELSNFSP